MRPDYRPEPGDFDIDARLSSELSGYLHQAWSESTRCQVAETVRRALVDLLNAYDPTVTVGDAADMRESDPCAWPDVAFRLRYDQATQIVSVSAAPLSPRGEDLWRRLHEVKEL